MRAATPVQQAWRGLVALAFVVAVYFVLLLIVIKLPWESLVPTLFPGAVEKGLIAPTISWGTTFMLAASLGLLAAFLRYFRFPGQPTAITRETIRVIDAKVNAIAKQLGVDLDAALRTEVVALIERGKKIEAMALYREYAGAGVAAAKAHVELLERTALPKTRSEMLLAPTAAPSAEEG